MDSIEAALSEALEDLVKRRPTPMEVKSLAANIAESIKAEIELQISAAASQMRGTA